MDEALNSLEQRIEHFFSDLPDLHTERLLLRKLRADDLEDIFEYAVDPQVAEHTTWYAHRSHEDTQTFLSSVLEQYQKHQIAVWGIEHKDDRQLIGTCGHGLPVVQHARAELGYAFLV